MLTKITAFLLLAALAAALPSVKAQAPAEANAPSPYLKVSFIDLAVGRVKLSPGQKVEMTGSLETELSGTMVFLYNYGQSKLTSSTTARLVRQIVVTRLSAEGRAYILEHCGGQADCPVTVRGSVSPYGTAIVAESVQF